MRLRDRPDGPASPFQGLQVGEQIRDLTRVEPELGHRRVTRRDASASASARFSTGYRRCSTRNGGAIASGLSPTGPIAWQLAQCVWAKVRPR
jgi:hypothetical protein